MAPATDHRAAHQDGHVVQFYASADELIHAAGDWLSSALLAGDAAIVIARHEHRAAFATHLDGAGVDTGAATREGRLTTLDARATWERIAPDGTLDRGAFDDVVGSVVRDAAAVARHVSAYGEMVALLWESGDVASAVDLEFAWDDLIGRERCSVYCAYRSEPTAPEHADVLQRVCELHSAIVPDPVPTARSHFEADLDAATEARRFVSDLMRARGHDRDLLEDARIVVAELAANAILHARSPFSVSVGFGPCCVRIGVQDRSRTAPSVREHDPTRPSGRGLVLVEALAREWGVDVTRDGKLVWAELRW